MSSMLGPNSLAMTSVSLRSWAWAWPAASAEAATGVRLAALSSERRFNDVGLFCMGGSWESSGMRFRRRRGLRRHVGTPAAVLRDVLRPGRGLGLAQEALDVAAVGQRQ